MFDLNGKTALVTGAATGLGAAISVALAQSGADVAVSDNQDGQVLRLALPEGGESEVSLL